MFEDHPDSDRFPSRTLRVNAAAVPKRQQTPKMSAENQVKSVMGDVNDDASRILQRFVNYANHELASIIASYLEFSMMTFFSLSSAIFHLRKEL